MKRIAVCLILGTGSLRSDASAAVTGPRIAVLPVSDNAPPSLKAAQVAASHIEALLHRQGGPDVVDAGTVASAVRSVQERIGSNEFDWNEIAAELDLDLVGLLMVLDVHVHYLGAQPDHFAVGTSNSTRGERHLYEGKATLRLTVVDVEQGRTTFDEQLEGKKTDGYTRPHDASKYADIVSAVRDLAAIFDSSVTPTSGSTLTEDYAPLAMAAVDRATDKLADPLREAFPLRGAIILVEGRDLKIDIGTDSGIKKGMEFDVVSPGKVIIHPTTGEEIVTDGEELGTAKVSRVSTNTAVLKASRKAASAVEVGYSVAGGR
jgi:hypothetical protein